MLSGLTTGISRWVETPEDCQVCLPARYRVVCTAVCVPASSATGSGRGVRSSQMPPSAVAATR
jgi:hypothetical protein